MSAVISHNVVVSIAVNVLDFYQRLLVFLNEQLLCPVLLATHYAFLF